MFTGFDPAALKRTLETLDLPAPTEVRPLSQTVMGRTWRLVFGPEARVPSMVLRASLVDLGVGGPNAVRAALRFAHLMTDLPVARELVVVQAGPDGPGLTLESDLPGRSGLELAREPGGAELALRAVGEIIGRLEDAGAFRFGTRASAAGELLPRASDWRGEVEALLEGSAARIAAGGTGLGPRLDRVLAAARGGLDAASGAWSWALVHGDLHLGNLLFDGSGDARALSGVVDWDRACLGDPLLEWAGALQAGAPTLRGILQGYGLDRAEELLDPDRVARLELYLRLRCLRQLAAAAHPAFGAQKSLPRAVALEQTLTYLEQASHDGCAERAVRAALEAGAQVTPRARPSGARVLRRQVLDALRWHEHLGAEEAAALLGALAASETSERLADPAAKDRAIRAGIELVPSHAPSAAPLPGRLIPDRAAWRTALVARALQRQEGAPCLALGLLALGLRAVDQLDGAACDDALRGLEAIVEGQIILDQTNRSSGSLPPHLRAAHAWLGALAVVALALTERPEGRRLIQRLAEAADDAWEVLRSAGREGASVQDPLLSALEPILTLALAWGVAPPGTTLSPAEAHRTLWPGQTQPV